MSQTVRAIVLPRFGLALVIFCFAALPVVVHADSKEHPIQGTITALGTSQETTGGGGSTPVSTHSHRTYTVRTDSRIFVLECPYNMEGLHIAAPSECGGKKKLAIGDTIHFRVQKNHAFILTVEGHEEKMRVISEALSQAGDSAPSALQP